MTYKSRFCLQPETVPSFLSFHASGATRVRKLSKLEASIRNTNSRGVNRAALISRPETPLTMGDPRQLPPRQRARITCGAHPPTLRGMSRCNRPLSGSRRAGAGANGKCRISCHDFVDNQVRLPLFAPAYNLGNFLRRLALPQSVRHWSLTTLREKLVKIGAKVVAHSRYVTFQMAEVAIPRRLFRTILRRISRLGSLAPAPT